MAVGCVEPCGEVGPFGDIPDDLLVDTGNAVFVVSATDQSDTAQAFQQILARDAHAPAKGRWIAVRVEAFSPGPIVMNEFSGWRCNQCRYMSAM